jgi:hypothetical protein
VKVTVINTLYASLQSIIERIPSFTAFVLYGCAAGMRAMLKGGMVTASSSAGTMAILVDDFSFGIRVVAFVVSAAIVSAVRYLGLAITKHPMLTQIGIVASALRTLDQNCCSFGVPYPLALSGNRCRKLKPRPCDFGSTSGGFLGFA